MDLESIKVNLDDMGYYVVEDVMPTEEADRMSDCYNAPTIVGTKAASSCLTISRACEHDTS
mgnify:FL=1